MAAALFPEQTFHMLEAYVEAAVAHRVARDNPTGRNMLELSKQRFLARQRLMEALTGKTWVPETWEPEFEAGKKPAKKTTSKPVAPSDDNEFA